MASTLIAPAAGAHGMASLNELTDRVVGAPGMVQRRAIAKAITLLESTRPSDRTVVAHSDSA